VNKKCHVIYSTIILVGLWLIFRFYFGKEYFTITLVIAAIPMCLYSDIDCSIPPFGHRNWLFHSIIVWVVIFIFNPMFVFVLFIFAIGIHCLLDIRFCARKRVGFYTIKIWMIPTLSILDKENKQNIIVWKTLWGLNGAWSTLFLVANFLISIIILGWFLYVY
jgi:hypothetical protein